MGKVIKIRKGKSIQLVGEAVKEILGKHSSSTYAIKPTDFKGMVPKLEVKVGDEVKAGTALFHSKADSSIKFTSPVSGEVVEVVRGDRRAIQEVKVLADSENSYVNFGAGNPSQMSREDIVSKLKSAGAWPALRQRPFNVLADSEDSPKAIFISGFDTAPLAADLEFTLGDRLEDLQSGIAALTQLTDGKVHLSLPSGVESKFSKLQGVETHSFSGPHPAGVVGIQIHHIDPINKGDVVWTISLQHVALFGQLFKTGEYRNEQVIAVAGSELESPGYYKVIAGCQVEGLLGNMNKDSVRCISGNVLTGTRIAAEGYLGYFDNLISVIPEGDDYEFLGWLIPSYARPTISSTFPISKFFKKKFRANANLHGEERAFVVSGQYEKVLPMDIMPVQLLKSILAQDFEKMENLGIYEVVEEDLALCEFVCTSKIEVQSILRDGLDLMKEEG